MDTENIKDQVENIEEIKNIDPKELHALCSLCGNVKNGLVFIDYFKIDKDSDDILEFDSVVCEKCIENKTMYSFDEVIEGKYKVKNIILLEPTHLKAVINSYRFDPDIKQYVQVD